MRYFFVCPFCMAKVEYEEELVDQHLQCTCNNLWQFSQERVMSEYDYKNEKSKLETQYRIELNHLVRCSNCDAEHPYKLNMINKWIDCDKCSTNFQCIAKNVFLK
ncbi:MAG: hypothetical protein NE334_16825 [Lentisphaeraceae bacterium]|nr:hypothetical protein [Lentisphaeraceae bacterium]